MISEKLSDIMVWTAVREFASLHLIAADTRLSSTDSREELVEPDGAGYAALALNRDDWSVQNGVATYPKVEFKILSNANTVYGWFISDQSGDPIVSTMLAEPVMFGSLGAIIEVTPLFSLAPKKMRVKRSAEVDGVEK